MFFFKGIKKNLSEGVELIEFEDEHAKEEGHDDHDEHGHEEGHTDAEGFKLEDENGNEITWWNIERFVFNEDGQLSSHADLSEELFFQEQMGYYLTNE